MLFTVGALAVGVPQAKAYAQPAEARKHVLILYDEDKDAFPGLARIDRSLRDTLESELHKAVDFYSESLDVSQFQRSGYDQILATYYQRKYAGRPIDLIVAVLEPSLDFLLRHGDE